jgi:chromosome segregation ATPase
MKGKERKIEEKEAEIKEKEAEIKEKEAEIKEKERKIEEKEAKIEEKEAEIKENRGMFLKEQLGDNREFVIASLDQEKTRLDQEKTRLDQERTRLVGYADEIRLDKRRLVGELGVLRGSPHEAGEFLSLILG